MKWAINIKDRINTDWLNIVGIRGVEEWSKGTGKIADNLNQNNRYLDITKSRLALTEIMINSKIKIQEMIFSN